MTTAPVPAVPAIPEVPSTTPGWLVRGVALLVALIGPLVDAVDPGGHIDQGDLPYLVILAFVIVAAAIFVTHIIVEALHRYGLSKTAFVFAYNAIDAEAKDLIPEIKSAYDNAKPVLDQLPEVGSLVTRVGAVEQQVAAKVHEIPATDITAVEGIAEGVVKRLVNPIAMTPAAPSVQPPPPPASTAP